MSSDWRLSQFKVREWHGAPGPDFYHLKGIHIILRAYRMAVGTGLTQLLEDMGNKREGGHYNVKG